MERAEFLDLLTRLDDQTHWEWLGGWDKATYDAAQRKFLALAEDVQQALGEKCTIEHGGQIQDASFHGLLAIPQSCLRQDYIVSLRVSNFGSLATLYDADDFVKPGCSDKIKDFLKRHGYTYVPSWILDERYPGPKEIGIPNWGVRFFDYL